MTILIDPEEWRDPNKVTAPAPLDDYLRRVMQPPYPVLEDLEDITEADRVAQSEYWQNCPVPIRTVAAPSPNVVTVTGYHPDRPDEPVAWWESDGYRVVLSESYVRECYEYELDYDLFLKIAIAVSGMYRHRWEKLKEPEMLMA